MMIRFLGGLGCKQVKSVNLSRACGFSDFFRERDRSEFRETELKADHDFRYLRIKQQMETNKLRKLKIKERKERIALQKPEIVEQKQKLVIHEPSVGIVYPQEEKGIFAVVNIKGQQYKVMVDDQLVISQLNGLDINEQVVVDQVQLIGTRDYTAVGRPWVSTAKVYMTVEQQTLSQKVIVFKKKRRHNYKKNQGSQAHLTVLRVDAIHHTLSTEQFNTAVSLI